METLWFTIVVFIVAVYVLLDGFDIGAGVVHLFVAKTDAEREAVIASVGPVWDGNEVWLLAGGGTLYFAFPQAYASGFSGFYLPLMLVLWLLMLRGMGVELRGHSPSPLWRGFWDVVFSASSVLLAIVLGAALGNVLRGVPLDENGYFFVPLWTTFAPGPRPGALDWYTVLVGVATLAALAAHGAAWVALKTEGDLRTRARRAGTVAAWAFVALAVAALVATLRLRPELLDAYRARPWGAVVPLLGAGGLVASAWYRARGRDAAAFLGSCAAILGVLGGAAFAHYPNILVSTTSSPSVTVANALAPAYGLKIGLVWWAFGVALASCYFAYLYYSFRGKVSLSTDGGH